jgi:hypothetical protein
VNREKEVLVTKAKKPGVVIDLDSSHEVVDLCDDDDGGGEEGETASLTTTTTDDSMEGAEEGLQTKRLPEEIHPMWKPATFPDGTNFYYSDYNEAIRHVRSLTPHRVGELLLFALISLFVSACVTALNSLRAPRHQGEGYWPTTKAWARPSRYID